MINCSQHQRNKASQNIWLLIALIASIASCVNDDEKQAEQARSNRFPIDHLSQSEAVLGQPISVFSGTDSASISFLPPGIGEQHYLVFRGTYFRQDGSHVDVALTREHVVWRSARELVWDGLSPSRIPFDSEDRFMLGVFRGALQVCSDGFSGETSCGEAFAIDNFQIMPSILLLDLQPDIPSRYPGDEPCGKPVERMLGGVAYRITLRGLGFSAQSFRLKVSFPGVASFDVENDLDVQSSEVSEEQATLGFTMPAVPENLPSYRAVFSLEARDAELARHHYSSFSISVHRPINIRYDGANTVSEYFAPERVSNPVCYPAEPQERRFPQEGIVPDERRLSSSLQWFESFSNAFVKPDIERVGIDTSQSRSINFAVSEGHTMGWSYEDMLDSEGYVASQNEYDLSGLNNINHEHAELPLREELILGQQSLNYWPLSTQKVIRAGLVSTDVQSVSQTNLAIDCGGLPESRMTPVIFDLDTANGSSNRCASGASGVLIEKIPAGTAAVLWRQAIAQSHHAQIQKLNLCGEIETVGALKIRDWRWESDVSLGSDCGQADKVPNAFEAAGCIDGLCE